MDLRFTPLQKLLRQSVEELLAAHLPAERLRSLSAEPTAFDAPAWRALAQHGWLTLGLGGEEDAGLLEQCLVAEASGRALLPGPVAATLAVVPWLNAAGPQTAQALAAGDLVAEVAVPGTSHAGRPAPTAGSGAAAAHGSPGLNVQHGASGWHLRGRLAEVAYGMVATHLVVEAGGATWLVPTGQPGVQRMPLPALAPTGFCSVDIDCVLPDAARLDATTDSVLQRFALLLAAQMTGAADAMLRMSVEYARQREQFGRPIGAYQAIQYRCVDTLCAVEGAGLMAYMAAWRVDRGLPAALDIAAAVAAAGSCVLTASAHAHQVHGAMGYSEESLLPLFSRWARVATALAGSRREHLQEVATQLLDGEWR